MAVGDAASPLQQVREWRSLLWAHYIVCRLNSREHTIMCALVILKLLDRTILMNCEYRVFHGLVIARKWLVWWKFENGRSGRCAKHISLILTGDSASLVRVFPVARANRYARGSARENGEQALYFVLFLFFNYWNVDPRTNQKVSYCWLLCRWWSENLAGINHGT